MTDTNTPRHPDIVMPALLRHARTTYGGAMRRALDRAGFDDIPANGLYVIGGLALGAEDVPLSALIQDLRISKQAAGQLVDTLVMRGYLERQVDPADRRRFVLRLTERGAHAAAVQGKARDAVDAKLATRVSADDIAAARRVLSALIDIAIEARERTANAS
ncbi:MarR family transcriptional regulator [Sphingopyxis sp.]|uniref:MarR family winged helix-turn-helix transcriptional regulator n=1 Tax=Sphingopyxis sp. TaxID=1908224 RepID=UPI00260B6063|nr:MarR family transcriptional regulator [Sphingopyxis sp.]MCW0197715.1 MarR family transcriptional regulator [Sphingopyxis sp.]